MIKSILLKEYEKNDRYKIITKTTEIFPKKDKINVSSSQINELIKVYNARVFSLGILENKNFILQILSEGFNKNGDGKIVLGNLKEYKSFFNSLDETISSFVKKEQEYYKRLIIEACDNEYFKKSLIKNGFKQTKDIDEIKEILKNFIPEKDSYKYEKIEIGKDGKSYIRTGGHEGEIKFSKEMFIKKD